MKCGKCGTSWEAPVNYCPECGLYGENAPAMLNKAELQEMLTRAEMAKEVTLPIEQFRDLVLQAFPSEIVPPLADSLRELKAVEDTIFQATGTALLSGDKHGPDDKRTVYRMLCDAGVLLASVRDDLAKAASPSATREPAAGELPTTLPADILALCKQRGWNLSWTHRGVYLHLEASELIEALRGKGGDPLHEAADVLLVLMSITENAGLSWNGVLKRAIETCEELKTRPRYEGEEFEVTQ